MADGTGKRRVGRPQKHNGGWANEHQRLSAGKLLYRNNEFEFRRPLRVTQVITTIKHKKLTSSLPLDAE